MPIGNINVSADAKFPRLGRLIVTEAQSKDLISAMIQPESGGRNNRGIKSAGVAISGFQGKNTIEAISDRHLKFKYRNRSHIRLVVVPNGGTMSDNYQQFSFDDIEGQREFYGIPIQGTDFLDSQMDVDLKMNIMQELQEWVEYVPFGWQWAHAFAPEQQTLASLTTTAAFKNALRGQTLDRTKDVMDVENIGNPGGTAPATYTSVRGAFLSKSGQNILAHPNGAWSEADDDMVPTVRNLSGYSEYVESQNYDDLDMNIEGMRIDSKLTLVPPGWFEMLAEDPRWEGLENHVWEKGDASTVRKGFRKVLKLHGHYYVEWRMNHQDMYNNTPLYSINIGGGLAVYLCPTLSAGCFFTSMYSRAVMTTYQPDHHVYQNGVYTIIGTKMLAHLLQGSTAGVTSTRNLISYMVTVSRTNGTSAPAYVTKA